MCGRILLDLTYVSDFFLRCYTSWTVNTIICWVEPPAVRALQDTDENTVMIEHHTYTTEELRAAYKKLMEECQRRNLQLVIMPSREETPRQPLQKAIRRSAEEFEAELGNEGAVTLMPIENTEYFYAVMGIEDHEDFEKLERTLLRLFIDFTQQSTSPPQASGSEEAQNAMNKLTLDQPQAEQVPKSVLSKSAPPRLDFQAMPKVGDWV
jgi:hypothetical protein